MHSVYLLHFASAVYLIIFQFFLALFDNIEHIYKQDELCILLAPLQVFFVISYCIHLHEVLHC
ncbi:hypothetical protein C2G38_2109024 [Gigaspora rosea]|uniref:Uncharacterized protein n=1 Tax=Gigaspora rosea TaxID=44941 RepID=A0A397UQ49_9GLOM|nr:hypothetical protein C2G38_2109024 [Gigaspora rosea]